MFWSHEVTSAGPLQFDRTKCRFWKGVVHAWGSWDDHSTCGRSCEARAAFLDLAAVRCPSCFSMARGSFVSGTSLLRDFLTALSCAPASSRLPGCTTAYGSMRTPSFTVTCYT